MNPNAEANMSVLERVWIQIARFAKALEGIDDAAGDYMFSLGERVDKLEQHVKHLERQLHPRPGSGGKQL
jgi:hypothetical protein